MLAAEVVVKGKVTGRDKGLFGLAIEVMAEVLKDTDEKVNFEMEKLLFSLFTNVYVLVYNSNLDVCIILCNSQLKE